MTTPNLDLSFSCPHCKSQIIAANNVPIPIQDFTDAICPSCQYVISDDDVIHKLGYVIRQKLSQLMVHPRQRLSEYSNYFSRL
jgi:hypothetical protein